MWPRKRGFSTIKELGSLNTRADNFTAKRRLESNVLDGGRCGPVAARAGSGVGHLLHIGFGGAELIATSE